MREDSILTSLTVGGDLLLSCFERPEAPEIRWLDIVVGIGVPAFVGSNVFVELIDDQKDGFELLRIAHERVEGNVRMIFAITQGIVGTVRRSIRVRASPTGLSSGGNRCRKVFHSGALIGL